MARVSDEIRLERARRNVERAADLVVMHGPEFVWIFERFEAECAALEAASAARMRALDIARASNASRRGLGSQVATR